MKYKDMIHTTVDHSTDAGVAYKFLNDTHTFSDDMYDHHSLLMQITIEADTLAQHTASL